MKCREIREKLVRLAVDRRAPAEVTDHLEACETCRRFSRRLAETRDALRGHHAGVRPDGQFAARVLERISAASHGRDPMDELGWAAGRMLPAAVLLAVLCAWASLRPGHGVQPLLLPDPGDDALTAFLVSGLDGSDRDAEGDLP